MEIEVLTFEELNNSKLYDILRLRSEIFIVEQDCVYQDIDGKDERAIHVLGWDNDVLIAYARCFNAGDYFSEAGIGRILVRENYRKLGYGHKITNAAIKTAIKKYSPDKIKISAQTYLVTFYEHHGFKTVGDRYMEDGIPHVAMIKTITV